MDTPILNNAREACCVVKVGGAVVEDEAQLDLLLQHFSAIPGKKVLVHGGGRKATKMAAALGLESKMVNGRRITDKDMLQVVTMVYGGLVNKNLVAMLQARGVKMAVASNKFQEGTEHLIREFFHDIQFVAILGNRPGYPLKPDPEIVREVLAQAAGTGTVCQGHKDAGAAGIGPEDAIMVGDSPTDMRTAANGGIDAVAVSWGYRTEEELSGNQIAHSIEELRRILCFM